MTLQVLTAEDVPEGLLDCWKVKDKTLWYSGNTSLLNLPLASIVGTRGISEEGVARTKKLATLLVKEGFCIVSGMAEGVDRVAHQVALDRNAFTIAVMGTPIDECYPKEHAQLKERIAAHGLVLSQFPPRQKVQRSNFPRRNVLMAALSSVTFVVEAGLNSGTKHQVKAAIEMGRRVAFLASLVGRDYPWVRSAIESGQGFVIEREEDAVALLQGAPKRPPLSHSIIIIEPAPTSVPVSTPEPAGEPASPYFEKVVKTRPGDGSHQTRKPKKKKDASHSHAELNLPFSEAPFATTPGQSDPSPAVDSPEKVLPPPTTPSSAPDPSPAIDSPETVPSPQTTPSSAPDPSPAVDSLEIVPPPLTTSASAPPSSLAAKTRKPWWHILVKPFRFWRG